MRVVLVQDFEAFTRLHPVWNTLLERSAITHPFVTHEWITAWWKCFQPSGTPYILVVKDGVAIVALAPLMITPGTMYGCSVRRLHGMSNVFSERFELILGERPKEAAEAVWRHLKAHADTWDVLELRQVPLGSPTMTWFCRAAVDDGCPVSHWPATESPFVAINGEWEAYYRSLKKTHRAAMRKRINSLSQEGLLHMEGVQSDTNFEADFDDALRLESSAWKGLQGTAISCRDDTKSFFRNLLQESAKQGWLRLYFLTVSGKRIAVRIGLLFENRIYMLKSGYDTAYASQAPGHVLTQKILQEAWTLEFNGVEFLGNAERWKLDWTRDLHRHDWVFVFSRRLKPRILYHLKASVLPAIRRSDLYPMLLRIATKLKFIIQGEEVRRGHSKSNAKRVPKRAFHWQELLFIARRAIVRHGLLGTSILAARSASRSLSATLYQKEVHIWYAGGVSVIRSSNALPQKMFLERSGREGLELLSQSNLYGWSSAEAMLDSGGELWIVRYGEQAVSCCWVFRELVPTVAASGGWMTLPPGTACIEGVVTSPEYRGRGIAPAAWSLIVPSLRADGIHTIIMKVEVSNGSMKRAVMKAGFEEVAFVYYRHMVGLSRRVRVRPAREGKTNKDILTEVQKLAAHGHTRRGSRELLFALVPDTHPLFGDHIPVRLAGNDTPEMKGQCERESSSHVKPET